MLAALMVPILIIALGLLLQVLAGIWKEYRDREGNYRAATVVLLLHDSEIEHPLPTQLKRLAETLTQEAIIDGFFELGEPRTMAKIAKKDASRAFDELDARVSSVSLAASSDASSRLLVVTVSLPEIQINAKMTPLQALRTLAAIEPDRFSTVLTRYFPSSAMPGVPSESLRELYDLLLARSI